MDTIEVHHYPAIALIGCAAAALLGMAAPYFDPAAVQMRQLIALEDCIRADALTAVERDALGDAMLLANANGSTLQICPAGYPGGHPATAATASEILDTLTRELSPRTAMVGL